LASKSQRKKKKNQKRISKNQKKISEKQNNESLIQVETVDNENIVNEDVGLSFFLEEYNDKYIKYKINNWFDELYTYIIKRFDDTYDCASKSPNVTNTQVNLCLIYKRGASVWLSTTGELQYRLTVDGEIKTTTLKKAAIVLSSYCNIPLDFVKENSIHRKRDDKISIYDLMIIEAEIFDPYQSNEFFTLQLSEKENRPILTYNNITNNRDIFYINSFKPSNYLCIDPKDEDKEKINTKSSIILQYIYYLANYKIERFEYILSWLASFFQNLNNKSQTALVLVGNKTSGMELLFKNIIVPLFGEQYCAKILDHNLDIRNQYLLVKNKIFYNLHNISLGVMENKRNKNFIDTLLIDNNIQVEANQQKINKIPLYGQILITSDSNISYLDLSKHDYKIFKVPDNINDIYLNDSLKKKKENSTLEDIISEDLINFAYILKLYSSIINKDIDDDKNIINISLEEKINNFHNLIINYSNSELVKIRKNDENLYKELDEDFKDNIIKQKNIFKYFKLLYPEERIKSSRTLMVKLRKKYKEFYSVKALKNGKNGLKYFSIY